MEVANTPTDPVNGQLHHNAIEDVDIGDVEMGDMDLDLTVDPEMDFQEEGEMPATEVAQRPPIMRNGTDVAVEPTEEEKQPAPMKVYIHGVNEFTTEDVKAYSNEHFPAGDIEKIEWIDDASAKIVYDSVDAVQQALDAFVDEGGATEASPYSRPSGFGPTYNAKRYSQKPNAEIRVRRAALGDQKKAKAYENSRFYFLNPELDPRFRKEQNRSRRGNDNERGDYKRRRFDGREQRRREEGQGFDVNMYDDDAGEDSNIRQTSDSESYTRRSRRRRSTEDLFGNTSKGRLGARLRDRSASPLGDGDGRHGFDDDQPVRRTARQRSITPPHLRRNVEREYSKSNTGKELFPGESTNGTTRELFPMKSPKELFPNRSSVSVHRRTPAFDASDDTPQKPRSLADRITGRSDSKLHDRPVDEGVGFRGAAAGFNIRGAASDANVVKELFPLKAGTNAGKELFGEKIKGRGAARRRAEDMF